MSDTSIPNNGGQGGNEGGEGGQGGAPSLLNQGVGNDWLPEKFRTVKEGGSDLDLEASSRKLAASYAELEKSRAVGTVPKSAEEYVIDGMPEGVNVDEVKSDPLFKGILGRAHEAGIPQEHVNFFLKEYFGFAPDLLAGNTAISQEEARAELGKAWGDDQAIQKNLGQAMRAVKAFAAEGDGAGSLQRLQEVRRRSGLPALCGCRGCRAERGHPINGNAVATQDWEGKIAAIKADPAYMDGKHPQHDQKVRELSDLYQRRYGANSRQLGAAAVR
ncbi:hypothetical protein SNK04_014019 [Fusarium graminearum]